MGYILVSFAHVYTKQYAVADRKNPKVSAITANQIQMLVFHQYVQLKPNIHLIIVSAFKNLSSPFRSGARCKKSCSLQITSQPKKPFVRKLRRSRSSSCMKGYKSAIAHVRLSFVKMKMVLKLKGEEICV